MIPLSNFEKASRKWDWKTSEDCLSVHFYGVYRTIETEEAADRCRITAGIVDQPYCWNAIYAATNPSNGFCISLQPEHIFAEFIAVN